MVGREAYQNPSLLGEIDSQIFGENRPLVTAHEAVEKMLPYIEKELAKGVYLNHIVRHMLGAFQNCKGARQWRRHLSENACKAGANISVVEEALKFVENTTS
jgi:tRNA-dihydrouridine synthase A